MSQNINLFNPAFRKPRQLLTLAVVAQCLGITLAALFGYHYYLQQQVNGLAAELAATEKLLRTRGGFVDKLKPKPVPLVTEAELDAEIGPLEAEVKLADETLAALQGGAFGSRQGFAEYLRAFSRQSLGGLWLTGFSISGSGELEIRGRALSADLLPSYIQRLNREQALTGRSIARLEMSRAQAEPVADKDKGAGTAARTLRFLEFTLASETTGREKTP
ncbi:MAG: PilN domain-containing protein [Burkholderiales bacterium]